MRSISLELEALGKTIEGIIKKCHLGNSIKEEWGKKQAKLAEKLVQTRKYFEQRNDKFKPEFSRYD